MDYAAFLAFLKRHNACAEAYEWAAAQPDAASCWTLNPRSDWMLWLLLKTPKTPERDRLLRLAACDFAEAVLPIFEKRYPEDKRPRAAIEVARRFANGEATDAERIEARRTAAYAAYAAYAAAYAADAAAYAADAAYAAMRLQTRAAQADILRRYFPTLPELQLENNEPTGQEPR